MSTDNGVEGGDDLAAPTMLLFPPPTPNSPDVIDVDDPLWKGEAAEEPDVDVTAFPLTSGLFRSGAVEAAVVGDFCRLTVDRDPSENRLDASAAEQEEEEEEEGSPPSAAAAGDVALTCNGCVREEMLPLSLWLLWLLPWKPRPPPRAGDGEADREARSGVVDASVEAAVKGNAAAAAAAAAAARDEEDFGLDEEEEEEGSGEEEERGRAEEEERGGRRRGGIDDDVVDEDAGVGEAPGEQSDAGRGTPAADSREEEEEEEEEVTEGRKLPKR